MHKSRRSQDRCVVDAGRQLHEVPSFRQALKAMGKVLYAVQFPDGVIKLGYTADLDVRRRQYGPVGSYKIIAVAPGTREQERALHAALRPHRARGHEWYHPTTEVLATVNRMRQSVGLELLQS
jgi:hypothetical protein